jgi:CHAT domain-containing protein
VLELVELSALDLSRCELAVLSVAGTHAGSSRPSTTGLHQALLRSGVRHVITSLWDVDERGTAALFRAFYEQLWKEKRSVPAAFEAARDTLIRAGFGPGVWAGFVLYVGTIERE